MFWKILDPSFSFSSKTHISCIIAIIRIMETTKVIILDFLKLNWDMYESSWISGKTFWSFTSTSNQYKFKFFGQEKWTVYLKPLVCGSVEASCKYYSIKRVFFPIFKHHIIAFYVCYSRQHLFVHNKQFIHNRNFFSSFNTIHYYLCQNSKVIICLS